MRTFDEMLSSLDGSIQGIANPENDVQDKIYEIENALRDIANALRQIRDGLRNGTR